MSVNVVISIVHLELEVKQEVSLEEYERSS